MWCLVSVLLGCFCVILYGSTSPLHRDLHHPVIVTSSSSLSTDKGIVLALYDKDVLLGLSLLLHLRTLGVDLPVEMAHCGDLTLMKQNDISSLDPNITVIDVCEKALLVRDEENHPIYCNTREECHVKFRGFNIKILALLLSSFNEVMLLDADTLFFQSPLTLFDLPEYKTTGTLFFLDRVRHTALHLLKSAGYGFPWNMSIFQAFLATFDVTPFQKYNTNRRKDTTEGLSARAEFARRYNYTLSFVPSLNLINSHAWNDRTDYQMDSSIVLWNKELQERATKILSNFISINRVGMQAPGYGDKELFFLACELAEAKYYWSPWGEVASGLSDNKNVCDEMTHVYPSKDKDNELFHMNNKWFLSWGNTTKLYRHRARPTEEIPLQRPTLPGREFCPCDEDTIEYTIDELNVLERRKEIHNEIVKKFPKICTRPATIMGKSENSVRHRLPNIFKKSKF